MGKSTSLIEYAKRLGIEIPNTTASPLDIEAGKAGYEKYLADLEAAKNEKKANEYQPKNKFEKFIIKLSQAAATSGSENPTMQGLNNAITAMREDDSYMRPSDEWSDEERWAFGEKYAQNADDAFAFATELNNSKAAEKKRKQQEALARWTKQNAATRVLGTASSLGLNATLGGVGYLDALAQRAAGRETIAQHEVLLPHEIANTMQGSVATHLNDKYGTINDDVWLLGGKGVGDIYGLGMSMGQSALGAATGGSTGTLVQFFGMAASNGVTDALERGATADQALAFGTISGAAETITEMISVDKLLGITSAKGVQNVFKNVLKQAGQEAGEEFTTAMITNIADNWIMGGKSQFYAIVNQLVASGMDPEEAKKKAWLQTIEGIAYDTLAGALSGGISGAGATAINRGVNQFGLTKNARTANAQALETYTPIQNDLIAEGKQHKTSEKIATKMESKLAKGKELSGYDLRTLAYETQNAQRTADVETVRKAIIEKMKAEGLDESKAKSLGEIALNKAIGHEVSKLQETKLKNNEIASKVYRQISEEMMDSGVGDSAWAEETPIRQLRSEFKAQKAAEEAALRPKVTESPEVVAKNQEIAAKKQRLEALKDDIISRYGLKDKNYKISRASVDKVLTENKGQNAYKPKKGSKLDVSNINTTLTAKDIINLSNLEAVADALGTKIVAYSSSEQDNGERAYVSKSGEKITANGFFLTESGDIGIDIHAGINGEGVVLYTAAHEIAHEIKQVSEEHFDALEKVVTKTLINEGYSIESLLEIQRNKLIKEGQTPEKLGRQQFEALAREEMVADACMSFLASKNAIAEIKALKTENKGLWSVLKKIISKIFGRIDKVYQEVDPYTIEGRAIANARSSIKPVYDAFFSGVKEIARVNKAKAEAKAETTSESKVKADTSNVTTESIRGEVDGAVVKSKTTDALIHDGGNNRVMKSTRTEFEPMPKQTMSLSTGEGRLLYSIGGLKGTKIQGLTANSVNGFTGREVREYAMRNSDFTSEQIKNVNEFMDKMADFMEEAGVTYRFIGLNDVKNAKLHYSYNPDGSIKSIVLSAMVKNGDYPVNFDLSSICKKREAMSALIDKLAKRGTIDNGTVELSPTNIFKINTALKDAGYETACLGCFVESKRYNSLQWAKTFCNKWNAAVKKINPKATYFGYGDASFTDDNFTVEQAKKLDDAANKYITTTKTERLANALKKYEERQKNGLALVVRKQDGKEVYDLSKAAKDRLIASDTISDELKEKYVNCDTRTLTMADVKFLLENGVLSGAAISNKQAVTEMVKSGEAYQHLLRPSDLLTDRGISKLEALPNFHGVLYGHYGSGTPKLMQGYTPYNSEIALLPTKKGKDQTLAEYLYSIAGVRMQSFSDFQIQNIYDYLQMVGDLAAKKVPAHAYTKEISFARLLGMSGIKVNLSVMFDIDPTADKAHAGLTKYNPLVHKGEYAKIVLENKQGKWVYNIGDYQTQKMYAEAFPDEAKRFLQSIGFADAVRLQSSEGYSANCGIIGVGYSDLGINAMLDDNRIRYIIPYHASSLPADIKVATNIDHGTDYTPYQNNMKITEIVDKNGNKVDWSIKEAYKRLGSGQAVINELNEMVRKKGWVVTTKKAQTGHGTYKMYENLQETNDPRKTASNFMDWCIGNETLPLFYQFASHNNYYKMLFDFNVYDCVTEEYAPQEAVTNTYPMMLDGSVQAKDVTDGDFNTEYLIGAIDKQMSFMNEYRRNLDSDLDRLADNMEKGNYSLEEKAIVNGKIAIRMKQSPRNYSEGLSAEDKAVADKVIKNLKQQKMASEYGVRNYATYTDNRMNYEIQYSSAQGDPDYAHAYITWVNPLDFVYATTSMESVRERLKQETGKLDIDRLRNQKQAIYLRVDFETGQIVGHEGRHRMLALQDAGIDRVAVIIEAKNDEYWHTKPINIMHLKGQRFEERRTGTDFYIHDLLPLSERYASVASEIFAHDSKNGIRFSSRENIDKYTLKEYNSFGWVRANEVLATDEYHNFTTEFSKAKTSKEYETYKSDLDEYMIAVGSLYGDNEGVKNKIVFEKGTIANPEITRIIEIDADNETLLSDEREYIYALEKQGIRTEADDLFKVHTSINARSASSGKRSSNENAPNNNQLRADRGTGSGTAQKAERGIPENLSQYSVVQKFKDVSGKTRNVRRLNSQFMVEDTKRKNYLFNTIEDAINAENDSLITRYANKTDHSKSWVKAKVENDPTYLYNKIRFSPRTTVTTGQYEQMKANLSHSKVYSKKSAMELVRKVAPGIRNRSFESLSNQLWEGLNSYTTIDDKRQFAEDMSQIFIDRMTVDTLVKHSEWDAAVEKMAYLKTGIGTIDFRDQDASELKYKLDKKYMSLRSRWGYKKNSDGSFKRAYGLDEFISDLSREMPGMEYLAEMHPAEALLEVDKLYTDLSEQIKEKYESAYDEFSEEEMNEIRQSIAYEIMKAYTDLGDQTKISKYLAEKFEYYQTRIDFWKAENAKTKKISRWHGIISTKALQIKELKKGAFYNATQHHQDIFKDSIETLANIQWRGNLKPTQRISEIFANLKQWYTMNNPMLYSKDADVNLYSDTIATYISKIAETNGAFTEDIYAMVYDVMNHLYTMMRNYNRVFRNGRWEDAPDLVDKYLKIMEETKKNRTALRRIQEGYNTEFLEPMAVAKRADNYNENGFFTQTMEDLRRASINASVGEMNLRKEYDAFVDKNKKYLTNAAKETVSYRGHDIPKIHIIGLYMTMKREHARAGLALNGFEYTIKNKWWDSEDHVYVKGYVTDGDNVTQEMINEATEAEMSTIEKSFTDIDKQYVEILEKLFNEDLKRLKVERDMDRQGYTNAILDYYYPIIRGAMAENIDTAKISDQNRATNASFNKNTVKGARQRLVIISADAMVNRHINDMCKYYYMSQAIENYNVLYNCDVSGNANDPMNIAKLVKETKVWEKDVQYFKKLVSDMQGIRDPQTTAEKALEALRGNYAAFALGLNVKVLFTQFSSMIAAGDVIGFGSILSPKALKITSADIDTYCPLAAVRNYDAAVIKAMSVSDKVGKVSKALTWGIGKVDRLVVRRLFAACQVEAEKRGSGKIGTEENKIAAGKLLEQVIIETQQNSYATERSQAMRSKNEFLKAVTMFTADGMKIVSRMHEAYGEMRAAKKSGDTVKLKKARRKFARSVAVAVNIAVYMTAIACLFNWIYDRDDEEEDENKMLSLTMDTIGNFISALPIISDLYDFMVDGFEVESPMMDTVNNIFSGINNIRKDAVSIMKRDGERSIQDINRDLRTMLYGVGQATGIPFRNAYNLARGIVGNFTRTGGYKLDAKFYETSLASDFEDAIEKGDNYKASYVMSLIYDDRLDKTVSQSQINEIVRLSKLDYSVLPKTIPDEVKRNGKTYVLTATQKDTISSEYAKVTGEIDKLINSSFYRKLSNKDKAYMIDYYHDQYYTRAVNKALKFTNKDTIISDIVGFSKYAELKFLTKDIESDKDENGKTISGSKKEKVIEALKKTSLSEEKRLLYIASLGYSLTDAEKTKLVKYLNSLKLSNSTKEKLADMCGLGYKNGKITAKS